MSTRTYALSMRSFTPIKQAIASNDASLVSVVCRALGEDDPDYRQFAESMIMIASPPMKEPGCWNYLVEPLAEHFGLSPKRLPLDDWKHYAAWEGYRVVADSLISEAASDLLKFIEGGRPFLGSGIDHDGCMFAWLSNPEAKALLTELSEIDADEFIDVDLDELHDELIESLQVVVDNDAEMFIAAH